MKRLLADRRRLPMSLLKRLRRARGKVVRCDVGMKLVEVRK